MRLAAYTGAFLLIFTSFLDATVPTYERTTSDCLRIITPDEEKRNGWTSFRDLSVRRIDFAKHELGVEMEGKSYLIYFTDKTEVCNRDKHGTMRDLKIGDKISGFARRAQGKAVADIVAFNPHPAPAGIPVPGRQGWVASPYAPDKPAINVSGIPMNALVKCPYTGKVFRNPGS